MSETTDQLKNLLETVIRRLDASQTTADERFQAQLAYNEQVSHEIKNLAKQIDLTQADVDEARKSSPTIDLAAGANSAAMSPSGVTTAMGSSFHPPPQPATSPTTAPPPPPLYTDGAAQLPFARLVNHGPSLLPPRSPTRPDHDHAGDYYTKPLKHDFPRFDGDAPHICLERCVSYFELYRVPLHSWVTTAALYMDGRAVMWLQAYRQTHPGLSWPTWMD